jgi:hypothetical protein
MLIIVFILGLLSLLFCAYTKEQTDALNYFKKMKAGAIKYCTYDISSPTPYYSFSQKLDNNDVKTLVKALNKSKGVENYDTATPKASLSGLTIFMKSKDNITLIKADNGFWFMFKGKKYIIDSPEYIKFLSVFLKKYHKLIVEICPWRDVFMLFDNNGLFNGNESYTSYKCEISSFITTQTSDNNVIIYVFNSYDDVKSKLSELSKNVNTRKIGFYKVYSIRNVIVVLSMNKKDEAYIKQVTKAIEQIKTIKQRYIAY